MKINLRNLFAALAALVGASALAVGHDAKMLAYGWDVMRTSPSNILNNVSAWEQVPVDGVVYAISMKTPDGRLLQNRKVTTDVGWDYAALVPQVEAMRELGRRKTFAHSFVSAMFQYSKKSRLDWTDDAAWNNFAHNMGVFARVAREAGLAGICIDNEDYGKIRQFYRKDGELPYDELRALARKRGAQVFGEVFREKPDIHLLAFWFLTYNGDYLVADDLMAKERESEDLWPAFIEGMLSVMPDTARFYDGNEKSYYYLAEAGDYFRSSTRVLKRFEKLLEPAYRAKYRAQVGASAAMYLDAYVCTNSSSYNYQPPMDGGTQADRLSDNLRQAAESVDDGYIWFYGEHHPWIDWKWPEKGKGKQVFLGRPTWDKSIVGLYDTLERIHDPVAFAKAKFAAWDAAGNVGDNLFTGGDFVVSGGKSSWPKSYDTYQHRKSTGRFFVDSTCGFGDSSSMCLDNVSRGSFIARLRDLKPGQTCVIRVRAKGSKPSGTAYYTKRGAWRFTFGSVEVKFGEPDENGWCTGYASFDIIEGSDGFSIQFGGVKDEKVWYDALEIRHVR